MNTDIIQEQSAKIVNGVHHSWSSQGNTYFTFNVKFNSGGSGEFSAKSNTSPFQVNEKVEITKEVKSDKYATKYSIKKIKDEGQGGGGSGYTPGAKSTYNDPKTVRDISMGMCQSIALDTFINARITPKTIEDVNTLATHYDNWVRAGLTENEPGFRDKVSRKYYALQLASKMIGKFDEYPIPGSGRVIEIAETFMIPFTEPAPSGTN